MGNWDSGGFLARTVVGGVVGGLAAAFWVALYAAFDGLPWWSPLALYRADMWGLTLRPVAVTSLWMAVVTGAVWMAGLGLALGALFALIVGALLPVDATPRGITGLGLVFGLAIFALAHAGGVRLVPAPFALHAPAWARAVGFALLGAIAARIGAGGRQAAEGM